MKLSLFVGAAALAMAAASAAQTWATATARNPESDRVIVYRFLKELPPGFDKAAQPDKFVIAWKYEGARGMPATAERQRMDAMEDALEAAGGGRSATLALVSTGNNLRRWVYYVQSDQDFAARLRRARESMPGLPLELRSEPDPGWKTYEAFRATVRE